MYRVSRLVLFGVEARATAYHKKRAEFNSAPTVPNLKINKVVETVRAVSRANQHEGDNCAD